MHCNSNFKIFNSRPNHWWSWKVRDEGRLCSSVAKITRVQRRAYSRCWGGHTIVACDVHGRWRSRPHLWTTVQSCGLRYGHSRGAPREVSESLHTSIPYWKVWCFQFSFELNIAYHFSRIIDLLLKNVNCVNTFAHIIEIHLTPTFTEVRNF